MTYIVRIYQRRQQRISTGKTPYDYREDFKIIDDLASEPEKIYEQVITMTADDVSALIRKLNGERKAE